MFKKPDNVESKCKVGIFRKRETSSVVSNNSNKQNLKSKVKLIPRAVKSNDSYGSIFSKRIKNVLDKTETAPATPRIPQRSAISACSSATMQESHLSTTSRSSLSNKPGSIPVYIRNKSNNKYFVSSQLQLAKKQFSQIKKELFDLQNKAIEYYKRYRDAIVKFNKLNGKDEPPAIEELKIFDFIEQPSPPPIVTSSTEVRLTENGVLPKMKQITGEKILLEISQQVQEIQGHSFILLKEFFNRLMVIDNSVKLVENSEGGDTNLCPEKIQNLYKEIESKFLNEEKQQDTRIASFMTSLKQVMINEAGTPVMTNDGIWEEYANYRRSSEHKINDLEMKIKYLEMKRTYEEFKFVELTKAITAEKARVNELNTALTDNLEKSNDRKRELDKIIQKLKQAELANKRLEKQFDDKTAEMITKDKSIEELKNSAKSMQTKISKYMIQIQKLKSSMEHADEEHQIQIDRLKTEYAEEIKLCDALRLQINELNLGIADKSRTIHDENIKLKNNENELIKEIDSLKRNLNEMQHKNSILEIDRREKEFNQLKSLNIEMKNELVEGKNLVGQKNQEINELKNTVMQLEKRDKVIECEVEIVKLQELNNEKAKQLDQLKIDLNKKDESLLEQQRLLKIQSSNENEDSIKSRISDLNLEIDRRSYALQQLNQEVASKTEELQNLFSTLGAKNLEVKRQDHIIKMLVETHEQIRATQEGKIMRLQNENTKLKRFIAESVGVINNPRPYNCLYSNLRRQKRNGNTIIKVKKYGI